MRTQIENQVVDFHHVLFDAIFSDPFRARIEQRLRCNEVIRQVGESADAASQSLVRFFLNMQLTPNQVAAVLDGFAALPNRLEIDDISNPNISPESIVEEVLKDLPCPPAVEEAEHDAVYRVALHSTVQVLTLVGPVMAEWSKLKFSTTFELPRRIVRRLNEITTQLDEYGRAGEEAADERYELTYRDYLLQRFHRVEAGTVRMTTNLGVDLRELFVMPKVQPRTRPKKAGQDKADDAAALMDLAGARAFFGGKEDAGEGNKKEKKPKRGVIALKQVKRYPRNVIVGAPGSGKSTFLEWLQLQIANVAEELVLAGQQAIPLLLRVRQLDPRSLPQDGALIEKATASQDRARLAPPGWLHRQMEAGRVLFMLDGLDETEPDLRDEYVIPWLLAIIKKYPDCRYLISSRPTGYPPGMLRKLEFAECDLCDFDRSQISEYTRHWCTAVRLARNEPGDEARREGQREGDEIVAGFKDHAYIRDLVRNPLMLSAVCLVNYFEHGTLPEDRARLYELCVEGLLHYWDQRRGIHSEFALDEKLCVCREVAIAMQADDKAEYEADKVQDLFAQVLDDPGRATKLLEHIRHRTGLLIERRSGVFAFAHLTFQEYLAARAVHEGNRRRIDAERLAREHSDSRWQEVISLYCGLVPAQAAREMIDGLAAQADTTELGFVLADAYLSAGTELRRDGGLRQQVLERIAPCPTRDPEGALRRFPDAEVAPVANAGVGEIQGSPKVLSAAFHWLVASPSLIDLGCLEAKLRVWRTRTNHQLAELMYIAHANAPDDVLADLAREPDLYAVAGPQFSDGNTYTSQAEIALFGLKDGMPAQRVKSAGGSAALLQILRTLVELGPGNIMWTWPMAGVLRRSEKTVPHDPETWPEFKSLATRLAERFREEPRHRTNDEAIYALNAWADRLETAIAKRDREKQKRKPKRTAKKAKSPAGKKKAKSPARKKKAKRR